MMTSTGSRLDNYYVGSSVSYKSRLYSLLTIIAQRRCDRVGQPDAPFTQVKRQPGLIVIQIVFIFDVLIA